MPFTGSCVGKYPRVCAQDTAAHAGRAGAGPPAERSAAAFASRFSSPSLLLFPLFFFFPPRSLLPAGRGVTRGDNSPPPQAMSSVRIECVAKEGCGIGESPVWDEKEGELLFVDITGRKVCRWSPLTRQTQAIAVGKEPLENPAPCEGAACWSSARVPRQLHRALTAHLPCSLAVLAASTLGDARYRPDLVLRTFPTMFYYCVKFISFPYKVSTACSLLFPLCPTSVDVCCNSDVNDQSS